MTKGEREIGSAKEEKTLTSNNLSDTDLSTPLRANPWYPHMCPQDNQCLQHSHVDNTVLNYKEHYRKATPTQVMSRRNPLRIGDGRRRRKSSL